MCTSVETGSGHQGQPGHVLSVSSEYIRVWPGLDHMRCKFKEYVIWRSKMLHSSWAMPTFCYCTLVSASVWKPHLCFICDLCAKSDHLQACIEPCPSIDSCCRPQECYPAVCQFHMGLLLCKAHALYLWKATPTFLKHVLVHINLLDSHQRYAPRLPIHRYTY